MDGKLLTLIYITKNIYGRNIPDEFPFEWSLFESKPSDQDCFFVVQERKSHLSLQSHRQRLEEDGLNDVEFIQKFAYV